MYYLHMFYVYSRPLKYFYINFGLIVLRIFSFYSTDSTYIRVGSKYRLRGRKVKIFIHIVHPLFGRKHEFDYDLQLLKTFRSLKFSNLIQPIAFCDGECGNSIYVSGWGYPMEKVWFLTAFIILEPLGAFILFSFIKLYSIFKWSYFWAKSLPSLLLLNAIQRG